MTDVKLDAKILRIEPTAVDSDGNVYEQEIVLQLSGGESISAYDWHLLFTKESEEGIKRIVSAKELEGTRMQICLYVVAFDVKKTDKTEKKVVQIESAEMKPAHFQFYGQVIGIITKQEYYAAYTDSIKIKEGDEKKIKLLILDIGVGLIKVGLDKEDYNYEEFQLGDYVEVSEGWVELEKIY